MTKPIAMITAAAMAFAPIGSIAQTAATGGPAAAPPQRMSDPAGIPPAQSGPAAEETPGQAPPINTVPPLSRNGGDCTKTVCGRSNGG